MLFSDAPPALPQIKSGKVRALGVTTAKRMAVAPEIVPIGETVAGYDSAPWQMLSAPAGTPRPIVDRLHGELVRYVASPEGQKKLIDMGLVPGEPTPPAELARFVESEIEQWGKIVHQAGAAGIEYTPACGTTRRKRCPRPALGHRAGDGGRRGDDVPRRAADQGTTGGASPDSGAGFATTIEAESRERNALGPSTTDAAARFDFAMAAISQLLQQSAGPP